MKGKTIHEIARADFRGTFLEPLEELTDTPSVVEYVGVMPPRAGCRYITVVGSRAHSPYAKQALEKILGELRGQSVCIVSGLALGVDALAHRLALEYKIPTIAIPGSGLGESALYPASNRTLAHTIVESGGVVISECATDQQAMQWTFPKRNRLMARLADLVLVVEAGEKSGTLITARNATEYNVEVGVIPGSVFNQQARGSNNLLREGAQLVTSGEDIVSLLGLTSMPTTPKNYDDVGPHEQLVLEQLIEPMNRDMLLQSTGLGVVELNTSLTLLEIKGHVKEELGQIYKT